MNRTEFDKLGLQLGQKFDLKMKKISPCNIIFDGIKEYTDYEMPETYILYHRIEAVKLKDIIEIYPIIFSVKKESNEQKIDDQQEQKTSKHETKFEKSESKPQIERKYICSCGKSYANAGALWNHTKKTDHAKA